MLSRVNAVDLGLSEQRVAVILNGHARGVSPSVVRRIGRLLPTQDLFVSRTLEESRQIAAEIVDRGYDAVLLGGGDGTFVQCLSDLRAQARRRGTVVPSVGILKLGTGNALAHTLGASPPTENGLRRDLGRARAADRADLALLEVDGKLTPFAGLGLDAQILADFQSTTRLLDRAGIGRRLGAGMRYGLAVACRTTPRYLVAALQEVVAINLGGPAWRVGAGGRRIGPPIFKGEVLYRGRCSIAAASTIPFYGLGMKMFPYAQAERGRFQLRCASAPTVEILANLPRIWKGRYESDSIGDFLVDKVELRLERPAPIQIGGDLQPIPRDRLVLQLSSRPVSVIQ